MAAKYVILEHLLGYDKGWRFWTSNSDDSYQNTHSENGELWYKEVAFTDSTEEAIYISRNGKSDSEMFMHHMPLMMQEEAELLENGNFQNDDEITEE
jgi:hypothetical protein